MKKILLIMLVSGFSYADQYTLARDFPSYPKGTVVTQDVDGRYYTIDRKLWMDAKAVQSSPDSFAPIIVTKGGDNYYFVDQYGNVVLGQVTGSKLEDDLKKAGNYFLTLETAQKVASQILALLGTAAKK